MLQAIRSPKITAALLALPLMTTGCGEAPPDDPSAPATQALVAENGFAFNGFAFNGFAFNGFAFNGFAFNGFAFNGLTARGLAENGVDWSLLSPAGLDDPATHALATYVVSCALPAGQRVTYASETASYTFEGAIGLAPEWKGGACGASCQRWVSACLLARSNAHGEHIGISMRGEHKALAADPREMLRFPRREAAYFGNLFGPTPAVYACLPPERDEIPRVCGDDGTCPMTMTGSCRAVCKPGRQLSYRDCRGDGQAWDETITVFLGR